MQFTSLAVAALMGLAQATDVQVVSVGVNTVNNKTDIKFWPEKITAEPGTMVQFQFWAGNHTVTQSTFDNPCIPINNINSSVQGIYSGFQPVEASEEAGMIPVYTVMIQDSKPLWMYCSKGKHCQGGMSMVINENTQANASRSLEEYRKLAETVTETEVLPNNVSPGSGSDVPSESGETGGDNGGSGSGSGSGSQPNPPTPTTITTVPTPDTPGLGSNGTTPSDSEPTGPVQAAATNLSAPSSLLLVVAAFFYLL